MKTSIDFGKLPSDWSVVELGDHLIRLANGLTADQQEEPPGIPVSRIETISDGTVDFKRVRYIHSLNEQKKQQFLLQHGDILLSHINSDLHLGKTAVYSSQKPLLHGMNLLLLRTRKDTLEPYYIHYLLNYYRKEGKFIEIAQHAVNQSSLNQNKIRSLKIPLAPLDQQKLIVAEIEKEFSRLDEAVANLRRIKANLKRYKAAVLKAAVEGKLTEEWRKAHPDVEPASKLLERILAERPAKMKKGKPAELPTTGAAANGWISVPVGMVCEIVDGDRGNDYPKKSDFHSAGHCLFLSTKNVRLNGFLFEDNQFITREKHEQLRKGTLERGDMVFTSRGTIGNIAHYGKEIRYECVRINSGMFILRGFSDLLDEKFFEWYLRSSAIRNQIDRLKSGTAQPQLPIREFRSFRMEYPSSREQKEVVKEIEQRMSLIEGLEASVETNLKRADRLRQAILTYAFEGKLVPI